MALTLDEQIDALAETISAAKWHFSIWEALQESRRAEANVSAMNRYRSFFVPTMFAHLQAATVSCYRLFESRSDSVNFNSLKAQLKESEGRNLDAEPEIVKAWEAVLPIWKKVKHIRNKTVGHVANDRTQDDVFGEADLKPADVWNLISIAVDMHRAITHPRNKKRDAFNLNGKADAEALIATLVRSN